MDSIDDRGDTAVRPEPAAAGQAAPEAEPGAASTATQTAAASRPAEASATAPVPPRAPSAPTARSGSGKQSDSGKPGTSGKQSAAAKQSASGKRSTPAAPPAAIARYDETLRAPFSWWFIGFLFGVCLALIAFVVSLTLTVAGLVLGTGLCWWATAVYGKVAIKVGDGVLKAGPATLPAAALGPAVPLDAEKARALRTYEGDPRAFMLLRSYIATAVRVEVADPDDKTPYLYLSTRKPKQLAAAINALRAAKA